MLSLLSCVVAPTLLMAAGPNVKVQTLAGGTVTGTLESLSSDQLVVATSADSVSLPLSGVVKLSPAEAPRSIEVTPDARIEFTDGTQLLSQDYRVERGEMRATLIGGDVLTAPVKLVARVRLKHQTDKIAEQWAQILAVRASSDLLVVRKAEAIDYLEGTLGDVSAETVQFKLDGDNVPVKRPKVEGLIYYRGAAEESPAAICQATDASGSEIPVKSISLDGDQLQLTTPAGVKLTRKWERIVHIDFSRGKIVPLADLKIESLELPSTAGILPERSRQNAMEFMKPRFDEGPHGDSLRVNGQVFARGAAIHSPTIVKYRISGKFKRFTALAGVDDNEPGCGSVRLIVDGDGKTLLDEQFLSAADVRPIDVELTGVKLLTLRVEYGDDSAVSDCLDLCEARMTK